MKSAQHTLKYIKENGLPKLIEDYKINVSKDYDNLLVLNYDQIESKPKNSDIVKECRQLILNKEGTEVISQSFQRFFNLFEEGDKDRYFNFGYGETKHDGSIISCFINPHTNDIQFASRSMAFAEGTTARGVSFHSLCLEALSKTGLSPYSLSDLMKKEEILTLVFELCSPENRIVTRYDDTHFILIGGRKLGDGVELSRSELDELGKFMGIGRPVTYYFDSMDEVIQYVGELPAEEEGLVLVSEYMFHPHHGRLKVKNPKYLELHYARGNGVLTPRRLLHMIKIGGYDEYISHFPEDTDYTRPYFSCYKDIIKELSDLWERTKNIENRKEFALTIQKGHKICSPLFGMKDDKFNTIEEALNAYNTDGLLPYIEERIKKN